MKLRDTLIEYSLGLLIWTVVMLIVLFAAGTTGHWSIVAIFGFWGLIAVFLF